MMKKDTFKVVPIKTVIPDPDQPRKKFDATEIARLVKSIERFGIRQPINVEDMKDGNYKIIDGERRYRAAKIAKLTEVPVLITESLSNFDRTIQQFHLQEFHLAWSPYEKALAIKHLADDFHKTPKEIGQIVGLAPETLRQYLGFLSLEVKDQFLKAELPLKFAVKMAEVTSVAKKEYLKQTEEEFESVKDLQLSLLERIQQGEVETIGDFAKVKDAIVIDSKATLKKLLESEKTVAKIITEAKIGAARAVRTLNNEIRGVLIALKMVEKEGTPAVSIIEASPDLVVAMKSASKSLLTLISQVK